MGQAKKSFFIVFIFISFLIDDVGVLNIGMVHDDQTITNVVNQILLIVLVNNHVIDKRVDII